MYFVKDVDGHYKFEGFKAVLYNELKPGENRSHFFKPDTFGFTSTEAYNLLAGRALEKEGHWLQFDLNDKDSSGNYRIKEFHADYGYDLEKILLGLPLKETDNKFICGKLFDRLKQGHLEIVTVNKNDVEHKIYVEANPHFKSLNFYDTNSKKISLTDLLEGKSPKVTKAKEKITVLKPVRNINKASTRLR